MSDINALAQFNIIKNDIFSVVFPFIFLFRSNAIQCIFLPHHLSKFVHDLQVSECMCAGVNIIYFQHMIQGEGYCEGCESAMAMTGYLVPKLV